MVVTFLGMETALTIKEVVGFTGLTPTQLRYWDRIGLVPALRNGRDRRYGPEQLQQLATVKSLMSKGWSPREIMALLEGAERAKEARPSEDGNAILRRQMQKMASGETMTFDAKTFNDYNTIYKRAQRVAKQAGKRAFVKKEDQKVTVRVA